MKFIRLTVKARNENVHWIVNPKQIIGVAQAKDAEYATVYLVDNNEKTDNFYGFCLCYLLVYRL